MYHLLIILLLTLFFTGCEDKEKAKQHDAAVAQKAREDLLAELKAKEEEKSHSSLLGKETNNGVITIDVNKTKSYLNELNTQMTVKVKKIQDDLNKGVIDAKEAGIEMRNEHLSIDLNKTQNALQSWILEMQGFVKEVNAVVKSLEANQTGQKK